MRKGEAMVYRWSGDHNTIINVKDNDYLILMCISAGIDHAIGMFKYHVHNKGILSDLEIKRCKQEIRYLRDLYRKISDAPEYVDFEEAKEAVTKLL